MFALQSFSPTIISPSESRKQSRSSVDLINSKIKTLLKDNYQDFEIFFFFSKLKSVHFLIPETLIEIDRNEIFYISSQNNTLTTRTKNPALKFFESRQNPKNFPKFIHFTPSGIDIFFNEKDAIRSWNSNQGLKHRMQRFLLSKENLPSKLRVHWRVNRPTKAYLIKKQDPYPLCQVKNKIMSSTLIESHLHKLSDFPYAGQIFKSSFNSFLPYRPLIRPAQLQSTFQNNNKDLNSSKFLAKFSNSDCEIEEIEIFQEVLKMVEEFVKVFKEKWENKDKKTLTEVLIDFICENEKWFLVKVKYFNLDYLPSKVIQDPVLSPQLLKKSIVSPQLIDSIFSGSDKNKKVKVAGLTHMNLMQRLSKIENKGNLSRGSGLRYIDMDGIVENNIRTYKSNSPVMIKIPNGLSRDTVFSTDDAVKRYDEFRMNFKSSLE